ncbi:MAG: RNase adapter RapZ [Deltaproteobacteria bacterium]|nr:RNase adapter RapZ [Deltaproteobacteria bacterium]
MKRGKIVIISGLSGSGKSTAIKALEGVGFFCVDNMPVALLPKFLELRTESDSEISKLALVMDIREKDFVSTYSDILNRLGKQGYRFEILFLEASEEMLLRRYSETRMQHPLSNGGGLLEAIHNEREQLAGLKGIADKVIDTSHYNVHELKAIILGHVLKAIQTGQVDVHILSFGYKYGIPHDADLVIDVRFLPNPYFVPELKELDGLATEVQAFVKGWDETQVFLKKYLGLLDYLIPLYENEGKAYLTVAVGCTGGRHRSVVIAGEIFQYLNKKTDKINLVHRDVELGIS